MQRVMAQGRAQRTFHKTLTPSYITLSSGDIKDLPKTVTDLNLARCYELTGKEGRAMAQRRAKNLPGNILDLKENQQSSTISQHEHTSSLITLREYQGPS